MILGENGEKMSKSRGNVVNPDDIVRDFGADTLRLYEMFIGDFEKSAPWSQSSIKGCKRFLERIYGLLDLLKDGEEYSPELESSFHKTVKKVSEDIEAMKYNTAIAAMMTLLNEIADHGSINHRELKTLLLLLNPFAPHITEEMWEQAKFGGMLNEQKWPTFEESKCKDAQVEIVVQICGKIKARISVAADSTEEQMLCAAKNQPEIQVTLAGKSIVKEIVVKGKLVNLVAK
jgi:leucyl-tRNA synthetase